MRRGFKKEANEIALEIRAELGLGPRAPLDPWKLAQHLLIPLIPNVERLMWGSDYPHTEGTFPFSIDRIRKDFFDVPEDETRKMVRGNAAALYGISRSEEHTSELQSQSN